MNTSDNLDPAEIAKFTQLADSWWDSDGPLKTLHDINPIRLQFIQTHSTLSNHAVLDVGCGGGILSESLTKAGGKVTAIDMDAAAIDTAKAHAALQHLSINYLHQSVESLAKQQPQGFDVITCMEMLEHVPEPADIIAACAQLLKPEGKLIVSTLNRHPKAYAMAVLGAEYLLHLLPRGTHDYKKFIQPAELTRWGRNNNLTVEALTGVSYQPFSRKCTLTDDMKVNYMLCFKKQI